MHESPSLETAESESKNETLEILVMDNLGELKTPEEAEEIFDKEDRIRVRRSAHLTPSQPTGDLKYKSHTGTHACLGQITLNSHQPLPESIDFISL